MPDIIGDAFDAVGASMGDYLELMLLDPAYRASFADGSTRWTCAPTPPR